MKKKAPSFQFYPGDWFKDPELRTCSLAARGAWFETLCLMSECKPIGMLSTGGTAWDENRLALAIGGTDQAVTAAIEELKSKGVLRKNSRGFFYSKRMISLAAERKKWRNRQQNHRDRVKSRHGDVTPMSRPSSSSSSSSILNPKTPLPPAAAGDETFFVWARETIGVRMGRRRRIPSLDAYQGARASNVVDFLKRNGLDARIVGNA